MPLAQVAPAFDVPKGKPVYITLTNGGPKDAQLQLMKNDYIDKAEFLSFGWSSTKGKEAAAAYGIEKAPAAILVDKDGAVVAKTQGELTTPEMEQALKKLVKKN